MEYTKHGAARCRQRGIYDDVVDTLLTYGRRRRRQGADVIYMDRFSRSCARRNLGERLFAEIGNRLDVYLVVADDGSIITGARRLRRLKWDGRRKCRSA